MRRILIFSLLLAVFESSARSNVLFIAVDDLNDWVGYLDGYPGEEHTPNLDRLAAQAALEELGPPVAVKLLDATILHKTEIGGVHLDVRTPDELDEALDALERVGASRFLVEAMAPVGIDLVVGAHRDPIFGPVVALGLGGTAAEALEDVSVRLAPLSRADAVTMLADLSGRRLLYGWRNGPTLDDEEIGEIVMAIGWLLATEPHLCSIEINPLRLTGAGLVALDAAITTCGRSNDK